MNTVFCYTFSAFTTPCELHIEAVSKSAADEIVRIICQELRRLENTYGYFIPHSEIYALNHRSTSSLMVSAEMANLLKMALFYTEKTQGAFDIAMAGTFKGLQESSFVAYQNAKTLLMPYASMEHLSLDERTVTFSNPYTQIDMGGLVKEYAVDMSIARLKELGVCSALVNYGGDLAVIGSYYGEKWRIGIQSPDDETNNIAVCELEDESLCTSGHSKRFLCIDGTKVSHLFSKESDTSLQQISLKAPTTMDAGVWCTALLCNPILEFPSHIIPTSVVRS